MTSITGIITGQADQHCRVGTGGRPPNRYPVGVDCKLNCSPPQVADGRLNVLQEGRERVAIEGIPVLNCRHDIARLNKLNQLGNLFPHLANPPGAPLDKDDQRPGSKMVLEGEALGPGLQNRHFKRPPIHRRVSNVVNQAYLSCQLWIIFNLMNYHLIRPPS